MTLYEKYAKHLRNIVCSYRDVDLDVALYYAIAAMDFLDRFGLSTWCDMGKVKDMAFGVYRDSHRDLKDRENRAMIVLDTVIKALDTVSFDPATVTQFSFDEIGPLLVSAEESGGILNFKLLQFETREFIMKAHALASACIFDRYAAIIPAGFEKDWELVLATYVALNYTGVLIQQVADSKRFYHMTSRESAETILKQGIRPSSDLYTSFGAGVIYTYDDIQKFASSDPSKFTVLELTYSGPYMKCMWRQDTEDRFLGECLLYPGYVSNIRVTSPERKTNLFANM